jgi:hypothetical protein
MIGLGVGLVLGLIPLALGIYKGKRKLGIAGLIVSVAAGAAWSLFSLIAVLVFVWLILRNSAADSGAEVSESAQIVSADDADETVH